MRGEPTEAAEKDPLSNDSLPAAFWDALPSNGSNNDLMAIKALQEESSLEERAETFKAQGNDLLRRGMQLKKKFFLQNAVEKYTEALNLLPQQEGKSKSTILSNRAQAHLKLGNDRSALSDALTALTLQSTNLKATFRAATAALRLHELERAMELCSQGLKEDDQNAEFQKLLESIQAKQRAAQEAGEHAAAARMSSKRLALEIQKRGWRVGAPQLLVGDSKPYLDGSGKVHWPVVIVYPEVAARDAVEDVSEDVTIQELVELMYHPESPPLDWDDKGAYTQDRVEMYYLRNAATPLPLEKLAEALHSGWPAGFVEAGPQTYGKLAAKPAKLKSSATLGEALKASDLVIPGVPVFLVLAKGTEYRDQLLKEFA